MKNIDKTLSPAWSRPLPRLAPPPSAAFARRLGDGLLPWLLPLGLALLWWVASHRHWMSAQVLPTPELVWQSARELLAGELWSELAISLRRLAWGLLAGVASGAALGAWLGCSPRAERLVFPTFSALAQIPTLAWIPLFMLFFGIGELLKLVVLVKAVVVPVTIHTLVGVRDAQPKLREAAAVLRLPPRLLVWRLILPAALPAFLTGLRLALAQGWTSLLAVELLASSEGIGYLMVQGRQLFMLDIVFVCILIIGLVGVGMDRAIQWLDRRLLHWPQAATGEFRRRPPGRGWQRLQVWLPPLALLLLWQSASSAEWVDPAILASPLEVARATWSGALDGSLPGALFDSLKRTLGGLLLGGGLGFLGGLLLGLWRPAERFFGPTFAALRQVAIFAWVPLLTAWFGLGEPAKLTFVAIAAFFPLLLATQRGIASLPPSLGEAARVLRLGPWRRLLRLVLPGAAPSVFAGLRLALIYAWLGTIGAEYFMPSDGGIGSLMIGAQQLFRMDLIGAGMLLVGLTGALLNALGQRIEARHALETRMNAFTAPATGTPLVSFRQARKHFAVDGRRLEAIQQFDLEIGEGEFIAIVGASGCGKSTLLRLLIGLDRDYDGEIRVDGRPIAGIGGERGIVFQEHRLFPWLTVQQNVALGLVNEALGETDKAARIDEYIRLVGLHGFERAYPHQLSGGMAQRVAIARGLVASPRLLLLDEPFSALDALTRQQLQEELLAIRRRTRITTLLVTHDVEEALYLADRVVVMEPRPGRIRRVVEVGLAHPRERGGFDFLRQREALLHELTADGEYVAPPPRRVENLPFEFLAC